MQTFTAVQRRVRQSLSAGAKRPCSFNRRIRRSRPLSLCSKRVNIGGGQRFTADRPVSLFVLLNADPGHAPHRLAFDSDHRLSDLLYQFPLLARREDILDDFDIDHWHLISP